MDVDFGDLVPLSPYSSRRVSPHSTTIEDIRIGFGGQATPSTMTSLSDWTPEPISELSSPWTPQYPFTLPMKAPAGFIFFDDGGCFYGFTVRRADGIGLGLNLIPK